MFVRDDFVTQTFPGEGDELCGFVRSSPRKPNQETCQMLKVLVRFSNGEEMFKEKNISQIQSCFLSSTAEFD